MLTRTQKSIIKDMMQGPVWPVLKGLAQELQNNTALQSKSRETEWESLKALLTDEGKIQGIGLFFQELEKAALNADKD